MAHHSYVDESIRGNNYYLAEVVISPKDVGWVRSNISRKFRVNGRLLHMHQESMATRSRALFELMKIPFAVNIIRCDKTSSTLLARQASIHELAASQSMQSCKLLILEQISSNLFDRRILEAYARDPFTTFPEFRHMRCSEEPLLTIPDVMAWSFGRGGVWRSRVDSKVLNYTEISS